MPLSRQQAPFGCCIGAIYKLCCVRKGVTETHPEHECLPRPRFRSQQDTDSYRSLLAAITASLYRAGDDGQFPEPQIESRQTYNFLRSRKYTVRSLNEQALQKKLRSCKTRRGQFGVTIFRLRLRQVNHSAHAIKPSEPL
jgi:hypothetical protein